MYTKAFCRNLEEHIRNCNPSNANERRLLELINEGMSLISNDSPHIMNYDYDFASERKRILNHHRSITRYYSYIPSRIRLQKMLKAASVPTVRRHITRLPYLLSSSHRKQRNCSSRTTIRNGLRNGLRNL